MEPKDPPEKAASPAQSTLKAWRPAAGTPVVSIERPRLVAAAAEAAVPEAAVPEAQAALHAAPTTDVTSGDTEALPLPVGSVIGQRYVLEQHISSGGFGAVYRASDREIPHHHVALKLLHRPSPSGVEREAALRELMLIASVSHPSVVQFKDYGWHEDRLWFAMPWYRGQTLDRMIGSEAGAVAMTRAEARPIFTRIAQGLAAMHAVGIHHHDIKPENIFVAEIAGFPGGLPVLLDLGIATQRGENPKGLTVEYASPETAAAMLGVVDQPIGGAADVFSLALVLRNALDPSTASPVRTDEVIPLLHQRSTVPVDLSSKGELKYLEPYFRRWLSLDPADRPSAAGFADQLAVLTEPEEKREARMRLLKRIAPIVAIGFVLIAVLVFQVTRQKSALRVQGKELQQERLTGESLRKQSEAQLAEIETQAKRLGNERQQLEQTIGIARRLNGRLADATKRADASERRSAKLSAERDALSSSNQALSAERSLLLTERDRLREEASRLGREREELIRDRNRLTGDRDQAVAQREALDRQIASVTRERDELQTARSALDQKLETVTRRRDAAVERQDQLEQRLAELGQDNAKLRADKRKLQNQVDELESAQREASRARAIDILAKKRGIKLPTAP